MPDDARPVGGRPMLPQWELDVVATHDLTPRMRRVVLTGEALVDFSYLPGQSLMLRLPAPEGDVGRREYTIRTFDRARRQIALDFLLHGETPGPDWARTAGPGARIVARGPRGRTVFADGADWHLFLGDETGIPAILHILEQAPAGTRAFALVEVAGPEDELPADTAAALTLEWVRRGGPAGPSATLLDRLAAFALPEGRGHAYIVGETSNVRAQRRHLIGRGLTRAQIASEGYWRPGRVGGHDHVED
jgi:NADPH-dependent ferric siderophore reductase